ncbi:MAG: rhomboid family protein [Pedosphaera sp.]|nr:rhomboid family protein [Pedosphaera sp.]
MHEPFTISLIAVTVLVSLQGFRNSAFVEKFIFCPQAILRDKEFYRLITSGFLHADWPHLGFNMFSLYSFGKAIEWVFGPATLLTIYFASIIGGNLLSLFLHRHHVYRAYGASGGVCGIIFASIFLTGSDVYLFIISIPGWLYAILFLLGSFYGIKNARDNVGHDAHLGGAIIGLGVTTLLYSDIVTQRPSLYAAVMGLSLVLLVYLVKNPLFLPLTSFIGSAPKRSIPRQTRLTRKQEAEEVNRILDKLSRTGMDSLTPEEQKILLEASRRSRRDAGLE